MPPVLVKAVLLAAAAVVVAWLAVGLRAVGLQEKADDAVAQAGRGGLSPAVVEDVRDDLRRAGRLNPDQQPLLTEGFLLANAGRRSEAYAVAQQVTAKEPDDFNGWRLMYATHPLDEGIVEAARRVRELNPWVGDRLQFDFLKE